MTGTVAANVAGGQRIALWGLHIISAALGGVCLLSLPSQAAARDLVATRPTVICSSEEALGRLAQAGGAHQETTITAQNVLQATRRQDGCIDLPAGSRVSIQMVHGANSVVIYKPDSGSDAQAFIATTGDFRAADTDGPTPAGAAATSNCLREGARVALRGVVTAFDGIDGKTGAPRSYVALRLAPAPCVIGKDGAVVSTEELALLADADQGDNIRENDGHRIAVTGMLVVGADGAPGLAHVTLAPRQ